MSKIIFRDYQSDDCEEMAQLFYQTVHTVNAKDYSEKQLDVWADGKVDIEAWNRSFLSNITIVAVVDHRIVGFGDMEQSGYLDRLYVHKDYQGMHVASEIGERLEHRCEEAYGTKHFNTHASITAKPFFEKRGYCTIREQQVERKGILLTNFVMEKI